MPDNAPTDVGGGLTGIVVGTAPQPFGMGFFYMKIVISSIFDILLLLTPSSSPQVAALACVL
jgi:hypothetical protein